MEQQADNPLQLPPSRRLQRVQILASISVYGLFFSLGITAANISRLFPMGGALYAGAMISVIGLSLLKAEVDAQKVIILAIGISAIAFWDAVIQFFFQPIFLGMWIIPLWQCLLFGTSGLMILIGIASATGAKD